jgi:hypothetical protein
MPGRLPAPCDQGHLGVPTGNAVRTASIQVTGVFRWSVAGRSTRGPFDGSGLYRDRQRLLAPNRHQQIER